VAPPREPASATALSNRTTLSTDCTREEGGSPETELSGPDDGFVGLFADTRVLTPITP